MSIRQSTFRWSLVPILLLLWLGFAAWQWHELGYERQQAEESLDRQCRTAHQLLLSNIVSHRRVGPFFDGLIQASLEEIVQPKQIVAVAVTDGQPNGPDAGIPILAAGDVSTLDPQRPLGDRLYRWSGSFTFSSSYGAGEGGPGGGFGGGFGRGRGRNWPEKEAEESRFQPGHRYQTVFVLDRSDVDRNLRKALWLRIWLVITAGLMLLLVAVAWLVAVRLVEAHGRERVLQAEADHLREMGQAAAGLAHETRNPLGLVRGWMQRLAQAAATPPEVQQQAQAVIEECDRVTSRINQFLSFAKPCRPERTEVDLRGLLAELTTILEADLEARQLTIQTRIAEGLLAVRVDREMFRQALFNLLANAVAFSPDQGAIEIHATRGHDGKVQIEIADRGPGVSAAQVDCLFTPYYSTRGGGTGLGLAIVKRIARAHGWQAGFRPRPGGGSIFWLAERND